MHLTIYGASTTFKRLFVAFLSRSAFVGEEAPCAAGPATALPAGPTGRPGGPLPGPLTTPLLPARRIDSRVSTGTHSGDKAAFQCIMGWMGSPTCVRPVRWRGWAGKVGGKRARRGSAARGGGRGNLQNLSRGS